jgi:hypothetical protein
MADYFVRRGPITHRRCKVSESEGEREREKGSKSHREVLAICSPTCSGVRHVVVVTHGAS